MFKDKTVDEILDDDSIETLKKTKRLISRLKRENKILKEQIKPLLTNNKTLTELVEVLEEKILKFTEDRSKKYVYSYEKGGWVEKDSIDKRKIELKEEKLSLDKINEQLDEIIRLVKLHKVRNLSQEQEINK